MTDIRAVLASNMKRQRKKLEISQAKLAERIDTAPNYIAMIETRKQFPSPEMIGKIAFALDVDSIDLFSPKPPKRDLIHDFCEEIDTDMRKLISVKLNVLEEKLQKSFKTQSEY
jgi:transcriptional regulator with XRE-family HTH domain